jgi:hypothetical protein
MICATQLTRAAVVADQSAGQTGTFIGSQDFTDQPTHSESVFDDFTIGTAFDLTSLTVFGREGGNPINVSVVARIYASPDLTTTPILSTTGAEVGGDLIFDFAAATLMPGTYWVAAYVVRSVDAGVWSWRLRLPISGSEAMWHNPGGGSGSGTSPLPLGSVQEHADMAFILSGEPNLPPRIGVETNVSGFRLSWTTNAADYRLENTDSVQASSWSVVTNTPSVSGAKFVVDVEVIAPQRYFRLHRP